MEKNMLNQYKHLRMEIHREEQRIREMENIIKSMQPESMEVADTVNCGKKGKKALGTCTIRGYNDNTKINRKRVLLRERKARQELRITQIENIIIDIEEFINQVQDSEIRMILREFYIENKSWKEVAEMMGTGYTAESCKKKAQRQLAKKESKEGEKQNG